MVKNNHVACSLVCCRRGGRVFAEYFLALRTSVSAAGVTFRRKCAEVAKSKGGQFAFMSLNFLFFFSEAQYVRVVFRTFSPRDLGTSEVVEEVE